MNWSDDGRKTETGGASRFLTCYDGDVIMILNEKHRLTANFRPVHRVISAYTAIVLLHCLPPYHASISYHAMIRHPTIIHKSLFQMLLEINSWNTGWRKTARDSRGWTAHNLPLFDFVVHPCQHTYHVFQLTVHFGNPPDEQLCVWYGRSHLRLVIDLIDSHSRGCHCCHIWLWWAVSLCMLFASNWNENWNHTTYWQFLYFQERYIINLFCSPFVDWQCLKIDYVWVRRQ